MHGNKKNKQHMCSARRVCRGGAAIVASLLLIAVMGVELGFAQNGAAQPSNPEQSLSSDALANTPVKNAGGADLKHGQQVALGQACKGGGCFACFQCHQIKGQGNASAGYPRLTGQSFRYLYYALRNFASGKRVNAVMQPIAKALSDDEMRDVAAYYAATTIDQHDMAKAAAGQTNPDTQTLIEGGVLAATGSAEDGVQGCTNCHGPTGAGLPPVYPYLGGQYADYLETQLKLFRDGRRGGDELGIMSEIAKRLSDEQIHAVAQYYGSIQPPQPVPQTNLSGPLQIGAPLGASETQGQSTTGKDNSR